MKKYLSFLIITLFVLGSIFAQDTKISANGVTVPNWMINSTIIGSVEVGWGQKNIGDILGHPIEGTKIKKINVKGNNLHLEYYFGEKVDESVFDLIIDFVCARLGDTGTAYVSHIKVGSRMTFQEVELSCEGPNDAERYGQCLGVLHEAASIMFVDEKELAQKQAEEEARKKEEARLKAERKRTSYIIDLEAALDDKTVSFAVNLDNFEIKEIGVFGSIEFSFLKSNFKMVVKNSDDTMAKLGFKKGDVVTIVGGSGAVYFYYYLVKHYLYSYEKSNLERVICSKFLNGYKRLPYNCEIENIESSTLDFTINRKGKEIKITTPCFDLDSLKKFNEEFEKKFD